MLLVGNSCVHGHPFPKNIYTYLSNGKIKKKCYLCHKESCRKAAQRWRKANPEMMRLRSRENEKRRRNKGISKETKKAWNLANPEKCLLYSRNLIYKRHGITAEIYAKMFESQKGLCIICNKAEIEKNGFLVIDHDHACCPGQFSCGKCIRGLLCNKCNQGIGCLQENENLLLKAAAYMKSFRLIRLADAPPTA